MGYMAGYDNSISILAALYPQAISSSVVAMPPSLTSWPADRCPAASSPCVASHMPLSEPEVTSGQSEPSWL